MLSTKIRKMERPKEILNLLLFQEEKVGIFPNGDVVRCFLHREKCSMGDKVQELMTTWSCKSLNSCGHGLSPKSVNFGRPSICGPDGSFS